MHRARLVLAACCGLFVCSALAVAEEPGSAKKPAIQRLPKPADKKVDFVADIQPLLRSTCSSCHGPELQESGLRLDVKSRALDGGDHGKVIIPGNSAKSRLIHLVAGLDEDVGLMPPEGEGTPLTQVQIALLRAWIDQGAEWPDAADTKLAASDHWSFQPVVRPPLPAVRDASWIRTPIDRFILARLEQQKIAPSPEADRATLIRRLYLDLLGLLPTPEEAEAFVNDPRPDAYEQLVDRLLASPHYGERWGRHWLDLARYADSDGYEKDRARPHAWRYRSWVIDALNADMPYDRFTREQIAGDMLAEAGKPQLVATGFHRNTLHNTEGGTDPEEDRVKKTVDRTNTLGTVWLGLTVGCAQCHSHKYDPLTHREYYSLYAFFNSIDEANPDMTPDDVRAEYEAKKRKFDAEHAVLEASVKAVEEQVLPAAFDAWLAEAEQAVADGKPDKLPGEIVAILKRPAEQRNAKQQKQLSDYHRTIDPDFVKLTKMVEDHAKKAPTPPDLKTQAVSELGKPRETHIHLRGDFLSPGEAVDAGVPSFLPPIEPRGERPDRLDLANWLVDENQPLTARVTVNRVWQRIFGRGLVPTVDDFGKQGDKPVHPALLDWLAVEFREGGWSLKELQRLIVTSAAYRQSSALRTDLVDIDPENALLARQSRRRVEAEIIRDLALDASGLLDERLGGPSVRPPQPAEYSSLTYAGSAKWAVSKGGDAYRRGLYTFFQRTSPYPMLTTFDSPDSLECTAKRSSSNTPIQALTLWNDPAFFEFAQHFGRRVVRETPSDGDASHIVRNRAERAFRICLGREPRPAELNAVVELHDEQLKLMEASAESADKIAGKAPLPENASVEEVAAWVIVGRALMNLDEFITRE
jgi:hypothetical protein